MDKHGSACSRHSSILGLDLVKALAQGEIGGTEGEDADLGSSVLHSNRAGNKLARAFKFTCKPLHERDVVFGLLGVLSGVVVSGAAGKVCSLRVVGPGQGAPADGVSVHIAIAGEPAQAIKIFRSEHFAAIERLVGIYEWFRHPVVHAQVEISKHKNRSLQTLGQIKSRLGKFKALTD